jgi:GTP-binding protein
MKFVDEAKIVVQAGKGGNGASSFLRLKFMPEGGPDGGDGGDGGSIYVRADESINTLIDYRYVRTYKAQDGKKGSGMNCTGKSGEDLILRVPVGTSVYDNETAELIADMTGPGQLACIAQGGRHGIGNAHFKSSVNRSPRRTIPGQEGERREIRFELKVLADVGLVGMPNAGKSTLISAMSAARPKIADYPFTTLYPNLGVVRVSRFKSFVMADLPGLIQGAASGAGLGIRFLKHVARTHLLLHVVDIFPTDGSDPVTDVEIIMQELAKFSDKLIKEERWLVLNKIDLLPPDEVNDYCKNIIERLGWKGRFFLVSGLAKRGLDDLAKQAMHYLETLNESKESE